LPTTDYLDGILTQGEKGDDFDHEVYLDSQSPEGYKTFGLENLQTTEGAKKIFERKSKTAEGRSVLPTLPKGPSWKQAEDLIQNWITSNPNIRVTITQ